MRRLVRTLKLIVGGVALVAMLWLGGLVWFACSSLSLKGDHTAPTDAIVVLTGGRLRVETALDLLSAGQAKKLFISGVNPHVDRVELLRASGWEGKGDSSRIAIGYEAENTLGNARETAEWMRQEGYRSLRLVTSWYHMQRSLVEFARAMPDKRIIAEPVFFRQPEFDDWSRWGDVAMLTIDEYDKFLATLVRPQIAVFWPAAADPADRHTATIADRWQ